MAVEKLSVSLPGVVVARARRAADREGVPLSAWLADAAVVIAAVSHNCAVLTSDPGDLGKLADAVGVRVPLIVV